MTRAGTGTRRPRVPDPYGLLPDRSWLAPGLSVAGLAIVAALTLNVLGGSIPFVTGSGNGGGGANRTAAPSNVVVVPPVSFPGSIVYAKAGNIWVQHGQDVHQLTTGGHDSMPSWSPDGTAVYFIRTTDAQGLWPAGGVDRHYQESVPAIMRVDANDTGEPETVLTRARSTPAVDRGSRGSANPCCRPTGTPWPWCRTAPTRRAATSSCSSMICRRRSERSRRHQNWLRSATRIRPGARTAGSSCTSRMDVMLRAVRPRSSAGTWPTQKATQLTGPGYLEPSYSPDGAYIAATRTSSFGNDVVILDAAHGRELLRVTTDGGSWAPVWSPAGDAIAFLHIEGQIVDLKLAKLGGSGPAWTVTDTIDLTQVSGLDGASRPAWYIPPDELPATPPPTLAPSASPSAASDAGLAP